MGENERRVMIMTKAEFDQLISDCWDAQCYGGPSWDNLPTLEEVIEKCHNWT